MSETQSCPRCETPVQTSQTRERGPDFCPHCRFPLLLVADKYKLVKELAEGGFGRVYEAIHIGLPHQPKRAIKFIKPELLEKPGIEKRFHREVRVTSTLAQSTPHVVQVFDDIGEVPNLGRYYVMEYLEGQSLQEYIDERGGRLTFAASQKIMSQLCHAMQVAHEAGVIHRDLKPDNVFLLPRPGGEFHLKVIDFGIAKPMAWPTQSITQGTIGTPLYMSPEQCMGKKVTEATDIYAMGIMFFELLVGYTPYGPKTEAEAAHCTPLQIVYGHVESPIPLLTEARPGEHFPPGVQELLERALAKQPTERFPSAADFDEAMQALARQSQATIVEPIHYQPPETTPSFASTLPTPTTPVELSQSQATIAQPLSQASTMMLEQGNTTPQQVQDYSRPSPNHSTQAKGAGALPWIAGAIAGVAILVAGVWASGLFSPPDATKPTPRNVKRATVPTKRALPKRPKASPYRTLPECPKTQQRWTFLAIRPKVLKRLQLHHVGKDQQGTQGQDKRKRVGICVGVRTRTQAIRLDGKGVIPCTIKPWTLAKRVPIFLQFEGGDIEPSAQDYCLTPGG